MSSVFPWLGSGSKMFRVQIMLRAVYVGQWDTFSANGKLWEDTHLLPTHTYPSILRADLEKSGCLLLDTVSEHSKLPSYRFDWFDHIRTTVRPCNSLVDRSKLTATRSSLEMCWANMEDRWRQLPPQYTACKQHQSSAARYAINIAHLHVASRAGS